MSSLNYFLPSNYEFLDRWEDNLKVQSKQVAMLNVFHTHANWTYLLMREHLLHGEHIL